MPILRTQSGMTNLTLFKNIFAQPRQKYHVQNPVASSGMVMADGLETTGYLSFAQV